MFLNKKTFLIWFILGGYTALIFFVAKKLMEDDFNEQLDAEYKKMKEQMKKHKEEKNDKKDDYWVHKEEPKWVKRNHEAVKKLEEDICKKEEKNKPRTVGISMVDEETWMTAVERGYDSVSLLFDRETGLITAEDGGLIEDETKVLGMTSDELRELDKDAIYIQNDIAKVVYEILLDDSGPGGEYDEE